MHNFKYSLFFQFGFGLDSYSFPKGQVMRVLPPPLRKGSFTLLLKQVGVAMPLQQHSNNGNLFTLLELYETTKLNIFPIVQSSRTKHSLEFK